MRIESFFDPATFTVTHLVQDEASKRCAIIDPVLDYDPASGAIQTRSADRVIEHVTQAELTVDWILETHAHADHLSAARYLKSRLGGRTGIGVGITTVQQTFRDRLNLGTDFICDGGQFDHLFQDGETFQVGSIEGSVLATPGHTPACVSYRLSDAVFVGDTLFMPDYGTARADFPGGDAAQLYRSIRRLLDLPPETRLFMCHDYQPGGRPVAWECTVAEQRAGNHLIADSIGEAEFVAIRRERDAKLAAPRLLWPSLQVNLRGGRLPKPTASGALLLCTPVSGAPSDILNEAEHATVG